MEMLISLSPEKSIKLILKKRKKRKKSNPTHALSLNRPNLSGKYNLYMTRVIIKRKLYADLSTAIHFLHCSLKVIALEIILVVGPLSLLTCTKITLYNYYIWYDM